MYCPKCGTVVDKDDMYCKKCGACLKDDVAQKELSTTKEAEFISPLDKAAHKVAHFKYLWNVLLFFAMALVWSLFVIAPFYAVNGDPIFYNLHYANGYEIGFENITYIWFSGLAVLLCCICIGLAITRYRYYIDTGVKRHRNFFVFWIVIASILLITAAVLFYIGTTIAKIEMVAYSFNGNLKVYTYSFGYGTPLFYAFMFVLGGLYIALISYQQFHNRNKKAHEDK